MSVSIIDKNEVERILNEELKDLCERIKTNHIQAGQKASGKTEKSIVYETDNGGVGFIRGIVYGRRAFGTLETGAKEGKRFNGFRWVIYRWMQAKNIHAQPKPYIRKPSEKWKPKYSPQERADLGLAWAISKSIEKRGTRLYQDGGRADIYSNEIPTTIERFQERIKSVFQEAFKHINLNSKKV